MAGKKDSIDHFIEYATKGVEKCKADLINHLSKQEDDYTPEAVDLSQYRWFLIGRLESAETALRIAKLEKTWNT